VRTLGRLALIALGGLALVDGGAWMILPPPLPFNPRTRYVEETPQLSTSPRFSVATNNYGFRNSPDFSLPLRGAAPRVLLIGDSFVFGGPNDATLDLFLSRLLPGHDVINGGSPGADVPFYLEMLRYYLPRIRPERLFVGLFLGNDFSGPLAEQRAASQYRLRRLARTLFYHPILLARRLAVQRGGRVGSDVLRPLTRTAFRERVTAEVALLCRGLSLDQATHRRRSDAHPLEGILDEYPSLQYEQGVQVAAYAIVYREHLAESLLLRGGNALRNYADALRGIGEIRELARQQGIEPVFVLIPVSFMLDARYSVFYRDLGYSLPQAAARYPLYERVLADLRAWGCRLLDLHAALAGRDAFFAEDWHLSQEGNRLAARELGHWIERDGQQAAAP